MVKEGVRTLPQRRAHSSAPSWPVRASVCGADSESFQSFAGCTGVPSASRATRPCCCAAMERALTERVMGPHSDQARDSARHQAVGSCSLCGGVVGGCGDVAEATIEPSSLSTITTLVLLVDESTPATSVTLQNGYRTPRSSS